MIIQAKCSTLSGSISIPPSKSHTIRAILIASLAKGTSIIQSLLRSADTEAAINAARAIGAIVDDRGHELLITGVDGEPKKTDDIDVLNSGTTLRLFCGAAALGHEEFTIDGDASIRKRPIAPLLEALRHIGASWHAVNKDDRCPIKMKGPLCGGKTEVVGITSQFISSLLIACPLASKDSTITVKDLHERPYVGMTMRWLDRQGIEYQEKGMETFHVPGGQRYHAFSGSIPADFSSATFPICAAAITGSDILVTGLDMKDTQGDKKVIGYLRTMGVSIEETKDGLMVKAGTLHGAEIDLNDTPDALPAMAVVACAADSPTRLINVAHARIKETDRITAMATELNKMGARVKELDDGLEISPATLHGTNVHGHHDHRIVMALSLAGMIADGTTEIDTAEAVDVTYPTFIDDLATLGAQLKVIS
ncbi:MAG: 3-phosphoshikimate 1-carboxyvinyltransferase [archaeon]